jgi:hypothetical protein
MASEVPKPKKGWDYSKFDKVDEFEDERKEYVKEQWSKYKEAERERKIRENTAGSKPVRQVRGGRTAVCSVACAGVTFKLTLSPKLLDRPFADSLVAPFLAAFNKKRNAELEVDDIEMITLEGKDIPHWKEALHFVAKDVVPDYTNQVHDPNVTWSNWHPSFEPPESPKWRTQHAIEIKVREGADVGGGPVIEEQPADDAPDDGPSLEANQ